jgi:hypothetical protein
MQSSWRPPAFDKAIWHVGQIRGILSLFRNPVRARRPRNSGRARRDCSRKILTHNWNCTGPRRRAIAYAWPNRALPARVPGNLDMNTAPDLTRSTTIAATDQTKAAAAPRIKLMLHGFSIDHPDPELGEQLMANALELPAREAMHGILRQLVKASVSGESPDEVNLSFMISMARSIKPRDSVEAMLVAQMVSVHVMAMRCAHHLANAEDLAQHDSAARALAGSPAHFPPRSRHSTATGATASPPSPCRTCRSGMAARPLSATSRSTRA